MVLFNKYGIGPFSIVLVHGGPGAAGTLRSLAMDLSLNFNVIEAFQTKKTIKGLLSELHKIINENCKIPVILIGHSWGAWLSFIYASKFPGIVRKLILIGAGAFDETFNIDLQSVRLNRLLEEEQKELISIIEKLNNTSLEDKNSLFARFGELMSKADSYNPFPIEDEVQFNSEIYDKIWKEAEKLRASGRLFNMGKEIKCPVLAIHGMYDPHPVNGVEKPLNKVVNDFSIYKLEKCGHTPWKEIEAKDKFYSILKKELI